MLSIARLQCLLAFISTAALVVSAVGAADGRKLGAPGRRMQQAPPPVQTVAALNITFDCSTLPDLQACATPVCAGVYELQRTATGTACVLIADSPIVNPPTPPAPVTVNDVYSSLIGVGYDYDYLFNFADDNAIGSASATLNANFGSDVTTAIGSANARPAFFDAAANGRAAVPGFGISSLNSAGGAATGGIEVGSDPTSPLSGTITPGAINFNTANSAGAYIAGTSQSVRDSSSGTGSADNLVFPLSFLSGRRLSSSRGLKAEGAAPDAVPAAKPAAKVHRTTQSAVVSANPSDAAVAASKAAVQAAKPVQVPRRAGAAKPAAATAAAGKAAAGKNMATTTRSAAGKTGKGTQPALRQAAADYGAPDYGADYAGGVRLLPGCRPRAGVICSDTDLAGFENVGADVVAFDDAAPIASAGLTTEATAGLTVTPEVYNGVYTTNAGGTYNTALTSQVGDGGLNANSETTFTGLNVALDDSNPAAVLPSSLTVTSDRTGITASTNAITYRPKYHYVVGANFGSGLIGLNTNTPFAP